MTLYQKLLASFDNHSKGFSARKLSAFAAVITAAYLSYLDTTPENVPYIIAIWLTFGLLCLGIITAQQVIQFKNGNSEEDNKPADNIDPNTVSPN